MPGGRCWARVMEKEILAPRAARGTPERRQGSGGAPSMLPAEAQGAAWTAPGTRDAPGAVWGTEKATDTVLPFGEQGGVRVCVRLRVPVCLCLCSFISSQPGQPRGVSAQPPSTASPAAARLASAPRTRRES